MAQHSAIAWTDHTFNPWIGCDEVGPACERCYARELDRRYQWGVAASERVKGVAPHWGIDAPRKVMADGYWRQLAAWNRAAERAGRPAKVFTGSLCDVFDRRAPAGQRDRLFAEMRRTPWLRYIMVTKRVPNIRRMLPADWGDGYPNVGLVATVVTQPEYDREAPRLMAIPARWHGFSMEPQIERIILSAKLSVGRGSVWVITGGESDQPTSGLPPRPYDPAWARGLISCENLSPDVRVFVKQMGARPIGLTLNDRYAGENPDEWPADVRVRNFPPELLN